MITAVILASLLVLDKNVGVIFLVNYSLRSLGLERLRKCKLQLFKQLLTKAFATQQMFSVVYACATIPSDQ